MQEEKYPEIWFNNKWSPICGHYFWENDYGATLFCQKLNSIYTFGKYKKRWDKPLASNGIRVGACASQDNSLMSFTGGCNDLQEGGQCSNDGGGKCGVGVGPSVEIECSSGSIVIFMVLVKNFLISFGIWLFFKFPTSCGK